MMKNNYNLFLEKLLAFESGVDKEQFALYLKNYNNPVIIYPEVDVPGRVIRDNSTGNFRYKQMTYQEYFITIGVDKYFKKDNPDCISIMQYHSTNVLGFIGYQIGESILISTNYYLPKQVSRNIDGQQALIDSYYIGAVDNSVWVNGCTETLYTLPGTTKIINATDTNRWEGTFTGKDNLNSLADMYNPQVQDKVILELMDYNYQHVNAVLNESGYSLTEIMNFSNSDKVLFTMSGVLAAAHLVGGEAVAKYLMSKTVTKDEFGTSLLKYLTDFSHYSVSYDNGNY